MNVGIWIYPLIGFTLACFVWFIYKTLQIVKSIINGDYPVLFYKP